MRRGNSKRGNYRKPYTPLHVSQKPSSSSSSTEPTKPVYAPKPYQSKQKTVPRKVSFTPTPDLIDLCNQLKEISFPFPFKSLYTQEDAVLNAYTSLKSNPIQLSTTPLSETQSREFLAKHLTEEKNLIITEKDIHFPVGSGNCVVFNKTTEDYFQRDWISDYFIEHSRLHAKRPKKGDKTGHSPLEEWNLYGTYVQKALSSFLGKCKTVKEAFSRIEGCDPIALFSIRESLYSDKSVQECASESPTFLRGVFSVLSGLLNLETTQLRIFDACAGWGDRLVASMSLDVEQYLGIEPNTNSTTAFQEMIELLNPKDNFKVLPIALPLSNVSEDYSNFHIAFFSPPSFDSEVYSGDKDQSIVVFPEKGSWIYNFLIPSLENLESVLEFNGYLIIQSILIYLIHPIILSKFPTLQFQGPIFSNEKGKNRYKPLWIYKKVIGTNLLPFQPALLGTHDVTQTSDPIISETLRLAKISLANIYPYNTHILKTYCGFQLDNSVLSDIARLRYETWKDAAILNPLYDLPKYEAWNEKYTEKWLDDNEHDYLHFCVYDTATNTFVATCRVGCHSSLTSIAGVNWLYNHTSPLEEGLAVTVERMVVDRRYRKCTIAKEGLNPKGLMFGGGISKMLDTICVVIARYLNARFVWCDVPSYRVSTLTKMGFTSPLFYSKRSSTSRTPDVEWQGMLLDLNTFSTKRGRGSFYSNYSGYSFVLMFRNLSDIPKNFYTQRRTFLISGHSGLTKNALRNIFLSSRDFYFVEYDEALFVSDTLKYNIDFLSLEWDSSIGSSMNPYFYEVGSFIKNVVDDSSVYGVTNKMILHKSKSAYVAKTVLLKDLKTVSETKPMIIRPVGKNACSSNDVYIISNTKDLNHVKKYFSSLPPRKYETVIASEYIRHPLLFEGKKMHIRMYLLVRTPSHDKTIGEGIFLFPIGKLLTAGESYVDGNYSALPGDTNYQSSLRIHDTHAESTEYNLWFPYDLGDLSSELYEKMWNVCREVIVPAVKGRLKSYKESANAYEILGLDFMFDHTPSGLVPKLIEANSKVGFSTIREPPEVGRAWATYDFELYMQHPYVLGNTNMINGEKGEMVKSMDVAPLTFGLFSELLYTWIYTHAIFPFLTTQHK
jgi:hypothetical protein